MNLIPRLQCLLLSCLTYFTIFDIIEAVMILLDYVKPRGQNNVDATSFDVLFRLPSYRSH